MILTLLFITTPALAGPSLTASQEPPRRSMDDFHLDYVLKQCHTQPPPEWLTPAQCSQAQIDDEKRRQQK